MKILEYVIWIVCYSRNSKQRRGCDIYLINMIKTKRNKSSSAEEPSKYASHHAGSAPCLVVWGLLWSLLVLLHVWSLFQ